MVDGSASYVFGQKLKYLKERISQWKKEEFAKLEDRKQSHLQKILEIE